VVSDHSPIGRYLTGFERSYRIFGTDHRGKGYAAEAVRFLSQYLFARKRIERLQLNIHPVNVTSQHVATEAGYTLEGVMRRCWFNDGRFHDLQTCCSLSGIPERRCAMEIAPPSGLRLHLEVELSVPAPAVFEALTDPEQLAQWWGPHHFTTPSIDLDLRVGGRYRFAMQPPDGGLFHLQGEFLEIEVPRRLAYTFRWEEPDADDVETVVILLIVDLGASTRLTVDQGAFASEPRRELHVRGWSDSLQRLQTWLSRPRSGRPANDADN
jgi:uncharacterized protein YndB with AHSA1/START domain